MKKRHFFSGNTAIIAAVIPAMDWLHNTLNPQMKKMYHLSILISMKLAQKKMNQYYSKTDLSSVYRIAMGDVMVLASWHWLTISGAVLHPGLKLEYFRQHEWDEEWIDMAENLVREEYAVNYQNKEVISGSSSNEELQVSEI